MFKLRTTFIIALLMMLTLMGAGSVFAQDDNADNVVIDTLTISLWPEFDDPGVLVIFSGKVTADTVTPTPLAFQVPAHVSLNAVAYEGADGGLYELPYTIEEGTLVTVSENGTFHLEYYDSGLTVDGTTRRYTFEDVFIYPINTLTFEVQQPAGSDDLSLDAEGAASRLDRFGLTILALTESNIPAGETINISFTYTNPDGVLSSEILAAQAPAAQGDQPVDTGGGAGDSSGLMPVAIILVVVGVLVIGGGLIWYVRTVNVGIESTPRRSTPAKAPRTIKGRRTISAGSYCTKCGASLETGDKFCRSCGERV